MGAGRRGPKKWVVLLIGLICSCVFLAAFVGCYTGLGPYDLPPQSRRLEDVLEISKSLGLPMTQDELVAEPPRDDQNAAPEIVALLLEMRGKAPDARVLLKPDEMKALHDAMAIVEEQSERLDKIALLLEQRPAWHIPRDYDLSVFLLLPEYADTKNAAKLFHCRGTIRAQRGDLEGALADLVCGRNMAHRLRDDPILIGLLVTIACDVIALRTAEVIATEFANSAKALGRLEAALVGTNTELDPRPALRGEFYSGLAMTRNFSKFGGYDVFSGVVPGVDAPPIDPSRLQRSGLPRGMGERASLSVFASAFNDLFIALNGSQAPHRGWGPVIDRRTAIMESRFRMSELLPRILLITYGDADKSLSNHDVSQFLALAFVRCMKYRAENGRWPGSLEQIDADFPDPFSPRGRPIKAKFAPNELRVWSVGLDGVDDGGKIKKEGEPGADTVFVWPASLRVQ